MQRRAEGRSSSSSSSEAEETDGEEEQLSVEGAVRRLCRHQDPLQPALADRGVGYGHTLLWVAEFARWV